MAVYRFDDSVLTNRIDEMLVNLDMEVLIKAKYELLKEHGDTSIIDKAINEKKRREALNKRRVILQQKAEKRNRKMLRRDFLLGLLSGTKTSDSNDLYPWENDALNDGYEPHNFEEEELEEDDFYYEDDK